MNRGDMVKHATDVKRSRGLVVEINHVGEIMVQWGDGEIVRYPSGSSEIVSLGWNLYAR